MKNLKYKSHKKTAHVANDVMNNGILLGCHQGMKMDELLHEMETIVFAGTKLNIDYWIEEIFDEDQLEELYDYFMEAETDDIKEAIDAFEGDFEEEDIRFYRLKFISEIAN